MNERETTIISEYGTVMVSDMGAHGAIVGVKLDNGRSVSSCIDDDTLIDTLELITLLIDAERQELRKHMMSAVNKLAKLSSFAAGNEVLYRPVMDTLREASQIHRSLCLI